MLKFLKSPRFKKIAIAVVVAVALIAGGWYAFTQYQYRQTAPYAFAKLKEALAPPNPNALAEMVDINAVSHELARAIAESFPFYKAGSDQERNIRDALQNALLRKFRLDGDKKSQFPEDQSEEALLKKNLTILPDDALSQILATLNMKETSPGQAMITAQIDHPLLKRSFTLAMDMNKTANGWKITRLANARELTAQTREALLARHARLREIFQEKNAATTKLMNQIIPIQSCTADAAPLSNGKTMALVVRVIARNKGDVQVNNFNVDARVSGSRGLVLNRFLNAAKPVAPGEDFDHLWHFDLETSSDLGRALLAAGRLQCSADWQTLSLNNGKVLHIVEVPNPDNPCLVPGHDHPVNFCELPLFK